MYTEFYGLREKPFALSPDPRYLYLSESHREALAHLLFGIEQGEGFIAITGEVGTGKTTLCRALLHRLTSDTETALIFNPRLSALELLQAVDAELGLVTEGRSRRELAEQLNRFLLQKKSQGRRVLLVVDEAQNLPSETLEEIRLLSNLETETEKLIQIVLLGQPELDAMLESPALRQLRQRVSVRWRLRPLSAGETREYVRHRLRIAAGAERDLFTEVALREIHRRSGGIPRVINLLCDRSLLAGFGAQSKTIGVGLVNEAEKEVSGGAPVARVASAAPPGATRFLWPGVALAAIAAVVALALLLDLPSLRSASPPVVSAPAPDLVARPVAPEPTREPVPVATPDPPPVEEPARRPVAELSHMLVRSSPGIGTARSLDVALQSWGHEPTAEDYVSFPKALGALISSGLEVVPLPETNLERLAKLNHPVFVQVRAPDGVIRSLFLVGLDESRVRLVGLAEDGRAYAFPRGDFETYWEGEAFLVWRDFEDLPEVLRPGQQGAPVMWLQHSLQRLGFHSGELTGVFDRATIQSVRRFQEEQALNVDGTVGPLTKVALYERLGTHEVPRLAGPTGDAG